MKRSIYEICAVLLSAAATALPCEAADVLNLRCVQHPEGAAEPVSQNDYHFNFKRMEWCSDGCSVSAKFTATPKELKLVEKNEVVAEGNRHREELVINRLSGAIYWLSAVQMADGTGQATTYSGACHQLHSAAPARLF